VRVHHEYRENAAAVDEIPMTQSRHKRPSMSQKIVVIGSSNVDFIMKMEHLPEKGETTTNAQFMQTYGGKGANQALGAAKAGGEVWFVSCVGDDASAPLLKANLRQAGVHVDDVFEEKGIASGAALVMVGSAGENYISVAPGANYRLGPEKIQGLEPLLRDAAMVILQYEILPETLYAAIDLAYALGKPVLFNLAPASPFDDARLSKIAYLVVNESEAQSLCGFEVNTPQQVKQAAETLLAKGIQTVMITLGADGVYVASPTMWQKIPAFKVDAVDTTAAGDVFCGALAVALVEGKSLPDAVRFAGAAAAICVTRLGAQSSVPSRDEIEQFLAERGA
jgi:ribokinase